MCFSASVSFGSAAILVATGVYAVRQTRQQQQPPYWTLWALAPVFFGIQQAFEGRVWQELDAGNAAAAVPFALGFHFFSHFLWLWWIPFSSYHVEPGKIRKRVIGGCALFGAFAGSLVYSAMLMHPEWMSVAVREHSIIYKFSVPFDSPIHGIPITPVTLYGLVILVPLFSSSHWWLWVFGVLVVLSMALASVIHNAAFVSVWCFFAAVISLYLVYMIRRVVAEGNK